MAETWKGHSDGERKSQLTFTFEMMTAEGKRSCEKLLLKVRNEMHLGI